MDHKGSHVAAKKDCTVIRPVGIAKVEPTHGSLGLTSKGSTGSTSVNAITPRPTPPATAGGGGDTDSDSRTSTPRVGFTQANSEGGEAAELQQPDPLVPHSVEATATTMVYNAANSSRPTTALVWVIEQPSGNVQILDTESRSVWISKVPKFKAGTNAKAKALHAFMEGGQGHSKSWLVAIGYTDGVVDIVKAPTSISYTARHMAEAVQSIFSIAPPATMGTCNAFLATPHSSGAQLVVGYSSGALLIASPQYRRGAGLCTYRTRISGGPSAHTAPSAGRSVSPGAQSGRMTRSGSVIGIHPASAPVLHLTMDHLMHPPIPAEDAAGGHETNPNTPVIFYSACEGGIVKRHMYEADKNVLTSVTMWNAPVESPTTQTATIHSVQAVTQADGDAAVWVLWSPIALSQQQTSPGRDRLENSQNSASPTIPLSRDPSPAVTTGGGSGGFGTMPNVSPAAAQFGMMPSVATLNLKDLAVPASSTVPPPTTTTSTTTVSHNTGHKSYKSLKCTVIIDLDELICGAPEVASKSSRRDSIAAITGANLADETKQDRLLDPGADDAIFTTDKIRCISTSFDGQIKRSNDKELTRWVREQEENPYLPVGKALAGVGIKVARLQKVHNTMWVILLASKAAAPPPSTDLDSNHSSPARGGGAVEASYTYPPPTVMAGRFEDNAQTRKIVSRRAKVDAAFFGPTHVHVFEIDGKRELRHSMRFDSGPSTPELEDYLAGMQSGSDPQPQLDLSAPPTHFPILHEERVMRLWSCGGSMLQMADTRCLAPPPGGTPVEKSPTGMRRRGSVSRQDSVGSKPHHHSVHADDKFETASVTSYTTSTSLGQAPPMGRFTDSAANASHTLTSTLEATREEFRNLVAEMNVTALPMRDKKLVKEGNELPKLRAINKTQQKETVPTSWARMIDHHNRYQRLMTWLRFLRRKQTQKRDDARFAVVQRLLSKRHWTLREHSFAQLLKHKTKRQDHRRMVKECQEALSEEWIVRLRQTYLDKWMSWSRRQVMSRALGVLTSGTDATRRRSSFAKWMKWTAKLIRTKQLVTVNASILGSMQRTGNLHHRRHTFGVWRAFASVKRRQATQRRMADALRTTFTLGSLRVAYDRLKLRQEAGRTKKQIVSLVDALERRAFQRLQHSKFLLWKQRLETKKRHREQNEMNSTILEKRSLGVTRHCAFQKLVSHRLKVQMERAEKQKANRQAMQDLLMGSEYGMRSYYWGRWIGFLAHLNSANLQSKAKAARDRAITMLRSTSTGALRSTYYAKWHKCRAVLLHRRRAVHALGPLRQEANLRLYRQCFVTIWKTFVTFKQRQRRFDATISVLNRSLDSRLLRIYYRRLFKFPTHVTRRRQQTDRVHVLEDREAQKLAKRYLQSKWMSWLLRTNLSKTLVARRDTKKLNVTCAHLKKRVEHQEDLLAKVKDKIQHFEANRHLVGHMVATTKQTTKTFVAESNEGHKVDNLLTAELKKQKAEKNRAAGLLKLQRRVATFGEQCLNDWAVAMGSLEALGDSTEPSPASAQTRESPEATAPAGVPSTVTKLPAGTPPVPKRPPSPVPVSSRPPGSAVVSAASSTARPTSRDGAQKRAESPGTTKAGKVMPPPMKLRSATPTSKNRAAGARPMVGLSHTQTIGGAKTTTSFSQATLNSDRHWASSRGSASQGLSGSNGRSVSSSGTTVLQSQPLTHIGSASTRSAMSRSMEGMTAAQLEQKLSLVSSAPSPTQQQQRLSMLLALLEVRLGEGRNALVQNMLSLPDEEKQQWGVPTIIYGKKK